MSHRLIEANADLRRLREEGYNIDIRNGYLLAQDIPCVNSQREVSRGTLVSSLSLSGDLTNRPDDHTIKFIGPFPCTSDGTPIEGLRHSSGDFNLGEGLVAQHSFSSKPPCGYYENYYEKIKTYAAHISGHAAAIDVSATPCTFRVVEPQEDDSPFNYVDTASARAEINVVTKKLTNDKVAIVGVGGTGSYVLDLVAKTPVKEIHLFDNKKFSSHSAFRAPGAASIETLRKQEYKVDYFRAIYSKMRRGIVAHPHAIDSSNADVLCDMSTVFLCIDAGPGKKLIVEKLEEFGITFFDTGMGLYLTNETLGGILRVTTSEPTNRVAARAHLSFAPDDGNNEYDKNIQIADLNALNAALAVIRWKKQRKFYFDKRRERYSSYTIGSNMLLSDDIRDQD